MSKLITTAMQAYLAGDSALLATCWKVIRRDGTVLGFTDWDVDLVVSGTTYIAATGYTRSALTQQADLAIPTMEVDGPLQESDSVISSPIITDEDIRAGKYDFAQVFMFMVAPQDAVGSTLFEFTQEFTHEFTNVPASGRGIIKLRRGWTGTISVETGMYRTELRGLATLLQQNFIETYTLDCQADFGDAKCKKPLGPLTDNGVVTTISDTHRQFNATMSGPGTPRAAQFYQFGNVTWLTGLNAGTVTEIRSWDGTTFILYLPQDQIIQAGDTFTAVAGCDKSFATCVAKFANAINYRGFPYIPGLDKTMYPNASLQFPTSA